MLRSGFRTVLSGGRTNEPRVSAEAAKTAEVERILRAVDGFLVNAATAMPAIAVAIVILEITLSTWLWSKVSKHDDFIDEIMVTEKRVTHQNMYVCVDTTQSEQRIRYQTWSLFRSPL